MEFRKVGDTVYYAHAYWEGTIADCPVCLGMAKVLVKPFGHEDGKGYILPCGYCIHRHEGQPPSGKVVDIWSYKPFVNTVKIEGIESKTLAGGVAEVKYLYNMTGCSHNSIEHKRTYATRAEALVAAEAMAEKANIDAENKKTAMIPQEIDESWGAGYHPKNAAQCRKDLKAAKLELKLAEETLKHKKWKVESVLGSIKYQQEQCQKVSEIKP